MTLSPSTNRLKPTSQSPRGLFPATVLRNLRICTDHYRLTLLLPYFPPSRPGQFVQLDCALPPDHAPAYTSFEWGGDLGQKGAAGNESSRPVLLDPDFASPQAYLRRPFSIAARRDLPSDPSPLTPDPSVGGACELDLIHRVVGKGTRHLASLTPAETLSVIGPLGNGFALPDDLQLALLVGGGVGIPPMFYLAESVKAAARNAVAFVGAQRAELVPLTFPSTSHAPSPDGSPILNASEFAAHAFPTVITTDDGSLGMKGFVTQALTKFLQNLPPALSPQSADLRTNKVVIFCCGPTPMMKATAQVAAAFHIPCQVSLEQPMACGMGTCQSCVIKWHGAGPTALPEGEWKYKLTCTDGPVFNPNELTW